MSTPHAGAWRATRLAVRRASAIAGISCAVAVLGATYAAGTPLSSIAALGGFPTVRLLVHMKD